MGADHRTKPAWLRSAERQGLVSAMNATKWREVAEAMRHLPGGPPRYRIKDIETAGPGGWDREWYYHPLPYETIEWLDVDPDVRAAEVQTALTAIVVPVVPVGQFLRITGWLRPDDVVDAGAVAAPDLSVEPHPGRE
jgi:hypothetical protein